MNTARMLNSASLFFFSSNSFGFSLSIYFKGPFYTFFTLIISRLGTAMIASLHLMSDLAPIPESFIGPNSAGNYTLSLIMTPLEIAQSLNFKYFS